MSTAYTATYEQVCCGSCMAPIEGCSGRYADWMHSHTRSEFCYIGSTSTARPETPTQRTHRQYVKRHPQRAS